jgi:hypothetical protein
MLSERASTSQINENPLNPNSARIFADGEMAERIRRHPWETTAIGTIMEAKSKASRLRISRAETGLVNQPQN